MDRGQTRTASNARPQGTTVPGTVIAPIISGIPQRTEREIVFIATSNRDAGANMRVVDGD